MSRPELRAPEDDDRAPMTVEERAVWVYLAVFLATSIGYAAVVVPRVMDQPIEDVAWVEPMLWAIGLSIAGTIVGSILAAIGAAIGLAVRGRDPNIELGSDERDKAIERLGNRATYGVISAGMLAVLVLAMLDVDSFWIGNTAYAAGFIGAAVEAVVKIRAYRRGF